MENLMEKFISAKKIFEGKILNIHCDTVLLPNGKEASREVVDHPGAVGIVPILNDGKIVLVRQYRYPIDRITLEIPAGKLDFKENPDACAIRELREETGYETKNIRKLTSIYTAPGFSNEIIHLYIAQDLLLKEVCPDEDEFINVEIYDPVQIRTMINNGIINDAKTLIGLLLAGV